jgi:hypothetical protein
MQMGVRRPGREWDAQERRIRRPDHGGVALARCNGTGRDGLEDGTGTRHQAPALKQSQHEHLKDDRQSNYTFKKAHASKEEAV